MKKSLARAALAACLLGAVSGTALMWSPAFAANDDKPAAPKITMAVGKPLFEAEKLLAAKDFAGAKAKIQEAQAVAGQTAYDTYAINQVLAVIAVSQNDYPSAMATYELMAASPAEPTQDKPPTRHNLVLLEYQAKNYAKTIQYGEELQAMGGLDPNTASALTQSYYFSNDFPKAEALSKVWVDKALATNQPPDQSMLGILFSSQAKSNDTASAARTLELLARYYSSPNDWDQLIDVALGTKGITNVEGLDLYRLRWAAAAMNKGEDYTLMATIAMQLGYPGEASAVLTQGIQMGRLSNSGSVGPAYAQAHTQAAQDEKLIPAFAAEAAKSSTGEKDEKLAETYYGYGRFTESEAAVRTAIQKDGMRDPGQAQVLLAMDLVNQGKYSDAVAALSQVTSGSPARMQTVKLWTIFAEHKIQETAPAANTAAPASAPAPATPAQ